MALVAVSYGYAQSQLSAKQDVIRQLRYRVFDVGTFGGPNSETNGGTRVINNKGAVVGIADTSKPCPYHPGFVSPAFMWRDGVLSKIGLLPGGCGSLPN